MNISGNFSTTEREINAVKTYLQSLGLNTFNCKFIKYGERDGIITNAATDGDILVRFPNGFQKLFEVKEERIGRIRKYNQLGIDFISAFYNNIDSGIYKPNTFNDFIKRINPEDKRFKWGKLENSRADIWLFYAINENNYYEFLDGYNFNKMKYGNFSEHLFKKCEFAVNNKTAEQLSYTDTWKSATFFIDRDDQVLESYRIKNVEELLSTNGFEKNILKHF